MTVLAVKPKLAGNVSTIDGPRSGTADTTTYQFDSLRRLSKVIAPLNAVTRYCYDLDGLLSSTNRARVAGASDPNCASAYSAAQWQSESRTYWGTGDLKTVTDAQGNQTQYAYDAVGRANLVTDPDGRKTHTEYDLAGQTKCLWKGWKDVYPAPASPSSPCAWTPSNYPASTNGARRYVEYAYTNNGLQDTVKDAKNNLTDYVYDSYDRLVSTVFPDSSHEDQWFTVDNTAGGARCAGSDVPCRKITRKSEALIYTYDTLDRTSTRSPAGQGAVTYGYTLLSETMSINEAAGADPAHTIAFDYDNAGRKSFETTDGRQVSYQWDEAGNRTRTTWPDAYFVAYSYDDLNRMQYARENSTTINELAFYQYDPLSRRTSLRLAGTAANQTSYSYELDSDLDVLTHTLAGASGFTLDYAHNGSHQITNLAASNDYYLGRPATAVTTAYTPNTLNQYSAVAGQAVTYDLNGDLLTWFPLDGSGKHTYTYDSENRLRTAAINGSGTATISYDYDALGRRVSKTVNGTVTKYLLDGDEEIAELDNAGAVLRRFITGPGIDDRIAMAAGSATTNPTKSYYHVNHQGSVLAMADDTGTTTETFGYDDYGNLINGSITGQPFRYTGRRYDVETGLYYYRARYYSPAIGRFLQADPVGYAPDLNLYTYVVNDPTNRTDPTGNWDTCEKNPQCNVVYSATGLWTAGQAMGAVAAYTVARITGNEALANVATESMEESKDESKRTAGAMILGGTIGKFAGALLGKLFPSAAKAGTEALKTTAHGAERIAGAGATRGGVLSAEQIAAARVSGQIMKQADGATVRVLQNQAGRFDVVVEGERGIITTFENLSQKSLDRLAKNYGWTAP